MSEDFSFQVEGLQELSKSFETVVTKYPDRAGKLLQKNARRLRKEVISEVQRLTNSDGSSKRSLMKAKSYKISPVQGFGAKQLVEISATSPHFHLVEHGHNLVKNGVTIGFVQGKHMMETATKKTENELPEFLDKEIDRILKEEGLI